MRAITLARMDYVFLARIAEEVERYDEMATFMKTCALQLERELNSEERNLLSVAFKHTIGWNLFH